MQVEQAYNHWAAQYDTNENKTRDLEAIALRTVLKDLNFNSCLEIGCGTGKNTEWLQSRAKEILAVDFSEEMLQKAKRKVNPEKVRFVQADITKAWTFPEKKYELIGFSLVLEHIQALDPIFKEVADWIVPGGYVYLGELHPFKQYLGSKARFNNTDGEQVVLSCFTHHVSDFSQAAKRWGFEVDEIHEFFDEDDRQAVPRILALLLKKS